MPEQRFSGYFLHSRIYGLFRLTPKSGFLTQSKKSFSAQLFSTEFSGWGIQTKNLTFSTGSASRKTQWEKLYTCFFNPSHCSSHHKAHTHTPIPGSYHTAVSYHSAGVGLAITAVASHRKSAWRIPSSARQQRASHDGSSVRYRCNFANNGYACYCFGGSRLSATPQT